jgi:hypothetical protein
MDIAHEEINEELIKRAEAMYGQSIFPGTTRFVARSDKGK